ncbi:MAG: lipocalin [Zetaproteobacteria bacterium CG1_02_53_45]|nr:MAG: lipocalin [Zetaproteobacteria bacterium CG1_02_53_45]
MSQGLIIAALLLLNACTGVPEGMQPVTGFELNRYLGKWYEIARLDHSFERGLEQVSAEYTMSDDGGVIVLNRGYSVEEQKWQQAEGKAYFVRSPDEGYLKVSFFGPFYGAYVIFELDEAYQYAFVVGPDRSYLWLLSRTPEVSPGLIRDFKAQVKALGFNSEALILVDQRADKH